MSAPDTPLVISLHGIKTRGKWQKDLAEHLQSAGLTASLLDYGYFQAILLLFPKLRRKQIDWFRDEYTRVTQHTQNTPSVVAHSFGTYIVAGAMELYPQIKFDRIIFCGAIVRKTYEWSDRASNAQFNQLLNDCGKQDFVVRISEWGISDAGPSGYSGFEDLANGRVIQEIHPNFKHSDYFYELNYIKQWIPFLKGENPHPLTITDKRRTNWKNRIFWIVLIALLFLVFYKAYVYYTCRDWASDPTPGPIAHMPTIDPAKLPAKNTALTAPNVDHNRALIKIQNDSGRNLIILLYACQDSFILPDPSEGNGWLQLYITAGDYEPMKGLVRQYGWYLIFVKAKCDSEPVLCGKVNLLEANHPTISVDSSFSLHTSYAPDEQP